jgi:hypothetical protein
MKTKNILVLALLFVFFYSEFLLCSDATRWITGTKAFRLKKTGSDFAIDFDYDYGVQAGGNIINRATWEFIIPSDLPQGTYIKNVELIYNTTNYVPFVSGYVSDFSYSYSNE